MKNTLLITTAVLAVLASFPVAATLMFSQPKQKEQQQQARTLSTFDAAMTKAFEALAAKNAEEARAQFEEAKRLDPKSILPWLGLADVANLKGDTSGIESALNKASELDASAAEPVIALARLQYSRKAYNEAETLWRKATSLNPKSPVPWVDLGDMYANVKNDPVSALKHYRGAVQVAPEHAGAHYAIGMMLVKQGDILGAITALERAKELTAGKNPLPSLALGQAYAKAKKWKQSREAFTQVSLIDPKLVAAYIGRASSFEASGDLKAAITDLKKAEDLAPKNPEIPFRLGLLYQQQRTFKEAYAAYERSLTLEPKAVLALNSLAWLAAIRGERLDEALAWIEKARELAPREPMIIDTHGWVLRSRGDLDKAVSVLKEGVSLSPTVDLHYHLGVVLMEKGSMDEAKDNLRKALQIQPDFSGAKDTKARLKQLEKTK